MKKNLIVRIIAWLAVVWFGFFVSVQYLLQFVENVPGQKLNIEFCFNGIEFLHGEFCVNFKKFCLSCPGSQFFSSVESVKVLLSPKKILQKCQGLFSIEAKNIYVSNNNKKDIESLINSVTTSPLLSYSSLIEKIFFSEVRLNFSELNEFNQCFSRPFDLLLLTNNNNNKTVKTFSLEFFPPTHLSNSTKKSTLFLQHFSDEKNKKNNSVFSGFAAFQGFDGIEKIFTLEGFFYSQEDFSLQALNQYKQKVLLIKNHQKNLKVWIDLEPSLFLPNWVPHDFTSKKLKLSFAVKQDKIDGLFSLISYEENIKFSEACGVLEFLPQSNILNIVAKTNPETSNAKFAAKVDFNNFNFIASLQFLQEIKRHDINYFKIPKSELQISFAKKSDNPVFKELSFNFIPEEPVAASQACFGKMIFKDNQALKFESNFGPTCNLSARLNFASTLKIDELCLKHLGRDILSIKKNDKHDVELVGKFDFNLFKVAYPRLISHDLLGSAGMLNFVIIQKPEGNFLCKFNTVEPGNLLFLNTANPFKSIEGKILCALKDKNITIKKCKMDFFVGSLETINARLKFADNWNIVQAYVPVKVNNFLINQRSDLFALIDSNLLFCWSASDFAKLTGNIVVQKSCYTNKSNLDFQSTLPSFLSHSIKPAENFGLKLDLSLKTANPAQIKIADLLTKLNLDLKINGSIELPSKRVTSLKLKGQAELLEGHLKFLGNNLDVKSGKLYFSEAFGAVPFIDILACGKIKKYNLNTHFLGLLTNPNIHFQSSPELSEEQIISLFLSGFGGTNSSLMQFLPGILIRGIEDTLTQNNKTLSKFGRAIRAVTRPSKALNIAPCLIDSKIENIGAAISLDIGPRLTASLKKGVNLKDHLSLQMEYLLSDNLSLKVGRGSQGDVEGELELRFKF